MKRIYQESGLTLWLKEVIRCMSLSIVQHAMDTSSYRIDAQIFAIGSQLIFVVMSDLPDKAVKMNYIDLGPQRSQS